MRIANYFNTSESEILRKDNNIFLGISLGNKYFTKEHLREYIRWGLEYTKQSLAILIPDSIHAINYEVRNSYKKKRAEDRAFREGEKVRILIEELLSEFSEDQKRKTVILKWNEIENGAFKTMQRLLMEEFEKNQMFKKVIIDLVKEGVKDKVLKEDEYERLAMYPIRELPMLIAGFEYKGIYYGLLPYPGLSEIDHLVFELQKEMRFLELVKKLDIRSKLRIIEAYAV